MTKPTDDDSTTTIMMTTKTKTKTEKTKQQRQHQKQKEQEEKRRALLELDSYVPAYLKRYVHPYNDEFCYCQTYHHQLLAQILVEGFLPIASSNGVMLPKLHNERCVIGLDNLNQQQQHQQQLSVISSQSSLHVSRSVRKKSKRFSLTVNRDFDAVVEQCREQHGRRCWLYPPLVRVFKQIHDSGQKGIDAAIIVDENSTTKNNGGSNGTTSTKFYSAVRLYSIEVWKDDDTTTSTSDDENNDCTKTSSPPTLVAGELGYSVGSVYTSLTGFSNQDSAGSVQLAALGRLLTQLGFSVWDLGMGMDYKTHLGAQSIPRRQFVDHIHSVRATHSHLKLPVTPSPINCKMLIDDAKSALACLDGASPSTSIKHPTTTSKQAGKKLASSAKTKATSTESNKHHEQKTKTTAQHPKSPHCPPSVDPPNSPQPAKKKRS
mmetsp:Transcript_5602/g.13542  ORF Transcript_5602/g.13542 Transcript_5602/m.13542 type:complete len:433 (-) Transcript_5602:2387-3685(-)